MRKLSFKWGVHALHEHEVHTLETFIIIFWTQQGSVTAALASPASYYIISDAIYYRYWSPIDRGGALVE